MKNISTENLNFFDSLIKQAYWFFKQNNFDLVNDILDEIIIKYDEWMYLHAFCLTESNEEYRLYDKEFSKYVDKFNTLYLIFKIFN